MSSEAQEKSAKPEQVQAPQPRMADKLCIVGCAESKKETPFDKKGEYEFWGVNNLYLSMPGPWTRWFEIHWIDQKHGIWHRRGKPQFRGQNIGEYLAGLASLNIPVYMREKNPAVPMSTPLPVGPLVQAFGDYFTNSVSWMIALGIALEFTHIEIYGVDMAVDTEYYHQRPSCEMFLGMAMGKGINVWVPDTCDLLKTRFLYGIQEPLALPFENKLKDTLMTIQRKCNEAAQKRAFHQKQEDQFIGAAQAVQEINKTWKNVTGS